MTARPTRYKSVFISYGGADEPLARSLYEQFIRSGVKTFFFPESAKYGQRLHRTMAEGVREYDRVVLVCSRHSLTQPGVLHEIEQVLVKEAEQGGTELIIPVVFDDYFFNGWAPPRDDVATQVRSRVFADFRGISSNHPAFSERFQRLLQSLA